jgi:dipeptidyl aminopeptidase/acylaminoacyl peptidase
VKRVVWLGLLTIGLLSLALGPGLTTALPAEPGALAPQIGLQAATPTPNPYAGLAIDDLAQRPYGGGLFTAVEPMQTQATEYRRYLVRYPSDGLNVYGFMNIPEGEGPFPVVIVIHGYVDPRIYDTLAYTTRYANALARAGYLTIHPNLRGYGLSDDGPNPFRIGFAVDILNLIALIREQGGRPGPLEQADPERIGLWGHSMGGGISIRVLTVSPDVRAAVLYGSMSADERQNHERIVYWSGGTRGREELNTPPDVMRTISPVYHLDRIRAAVSIHHGRNDEQVPLAWSEDLCQRLQALNRTVECFTYAEQPHTFVDAGDRLFIRRTVDFFDAHLRSP